MELERLQCYVNLIKICKWEKKLSIWKNVTGMTMEEYGLKRYKLWLRGRWDKLQVQARVTGNYFKIQGIRPRIHVMN